MGDLGASLAEVFVKVDDMMMQPEAATELLALRDGSLGALNDRRRLAAQDPLMGRTRLMTSLQQC